MEAAAMIPLTIGEATIIVMLVVVIVMLARSKS